MSKRDKKYLAFSGDNYYPAGGWDDFLGFYRTLDDAVLAVEEAVEVSFAVERFHTDKWGHVVDLDSGEIVKKLRAE